MLKLMDRELAEELVDDAFHGGVAASVVAVLVAAIVIVICVLSETRMAKAEPCEGCERVELAQASISHRAKRGRNIRYDRNDSSGNSIRVVGHPHGCPGRAFCGCGVSVRVFGRPVRELFLAANWRKFPSAHAAAGMVAWRYGHVMYIEHAHGDGTATVYDPNSGRHQTRIHRRSLAGYRIVSPHGRYAEAQ